MDRNIFAEAPAKNDDLSPSAKRAWIEISYEKSNKQDLVSPSAKRAWIEMLGKYF